MPGDQTQTDQQFSPQDIEDLRTIRAQMHIGDPRASQLDSILTNYSQQPKSVIPQLTPQQQVEATANGTSIGPQSQGFADQLDRQLGKIKHIFGADKPMGSGANEILAGPIIGPVQALKGLTEIPNHPIRGSNDVVAGVGKAGALPSAVFNPATLAVATPAAVAQRGVESGLKAVGVDKDIAELFGNVAGIATGGGIIKGMSPKAPPSKAEIAAKITDAVNPPAKAMPAFQKNIVEHLDKAIEAAQDSGTKITDRASLAEAFRIAAIKARNLYYDKMLGPVKDQIIDTSQIKGYSGATTYHNTATLDQLDARLGQINATLRPSYEQGGAQAKAAISAESKASLTQEAAAIRARLYQEIANRTGQDPQAVAEAKSSMGAMNDIADKITLAMNRGRYTENQMSQGQKLPESLTQAGFRVANKARVAVFGNKGDNAINSVIPQDNTGRPIPVSTIGTQGAAQVIPKPKDNRK
jgi:hypothetical protein